MPEDWKRAWACQNRIASTKSACDKNGDHVEKESIPHGARVCVVVVVGWGGGG